MSTKTLALSDRYRQAIVFAIVLQVPIALLFRLLLDDGQMAKLGGYSMIGFWAGVAMILIRRPLAPAFLDLGYIRFGYFPLLVFAGCCASLH